MKRILVTVLILSVALMLVNCGPSQEDKDKQKAVELSKEYKAIEKKLEEKRKTVNSNETYQAYKKEAKEMKEAFLKKLETAGDHYDIALIHGKVLFDLKQVDKAVAKFDSLIQKNAPNIVAAKFEKVRSLLAMDKYGEAEPLFKAIEKDIPKNDEYYTALSFLAWAISNPESKAEYAQKFVNGVKETMTSFRYKGDMYELLAKIEVEKGNVQKGMDILEKAFNAETNEKTKKNLEKSLNRMKLLENPAPELTAKHWINTKALKMKALKGKVVIVDFWAPWCPPCRMVIPTLIKSYNQLKDEGLVVVGFTRFYGSYRDDTQDKGKVEPDVELKLIKEFVERNKITYPVAVADDMQTWNDYIVGGIPQLVIIDKKGNVHEVEIGAGDQKALEAKIAELVK